ncbi:MAG: hypothetical protein DHS20C16_14830 [Phycisphaerae bacterium]|nr:MAG: hypothetical protein DHS20C16_14830 [Phycisphaerae bacterium]
MLAVEKPFSGYLVLTKGTLWAILFVMICNPRFRPQAVRELLNREALNMSGFAARVGVSRQRVHRWLTGKCSPQFTMVLIMCEEFGVDPGFFADGLTGHCGDQFSKAPAALESGAAG